MYAISFRTETEGVGPRVPQWTAMIYCAVQLIKMTRFAQPKTSSDASWSVASMYEDS